MQKHAEITRQRLRTFAEERGLRSRIYPESSPVSLSVFHAPDRITYEEALQHTYEPAEVGQNFGPLWSTHWFLVIAKVPEEWAGKEVHFIWDSSSEACVWKDGQPLQGLTGSGINPWETTMGRPAFRLLKNAQGDEQLSFMVEMACNGMFGNPPGTTFQLKRAEIAVFDRQAWDLYWDFIVIADMAQLLPQNSPRAGQALWAANEMINLCDFSDRDTWKHARQVAVNFLKAHNGDAQHNLSAIGYAHLDTAWLWPLAETKRKAVRTFTNTMRLMEDYPDHSFASAQAQHLAWIKEMEPALYEQVKQRIKEKRFVIVGGTWIEPDCNIPSGESLVRQFLHGQRFYHQEFGFTCTEFWNPDVFGYSAALPQIMRGAGMKYFLTQKLSWNQMNKPQNHTFLWEGIDGSQVLTHFPPADTYGSAANVADVLKSVNNFKEHDRARESILIFGWGDGGGGPTPEMLEQLARMDDVDGLPRVTIRPVEEFFQRCEADIKDPVVWVGELYFELHRGTYTTQANNKRDNRRSEFLLRDVELLSTLAFIQKKAEYPTEELDRLWKLVLLNQFHDIIPGSSITLVYEDSARQYADVLHSAASLRTQAIHSLIPNADGWTAVNTLGTARSDLVELVDEFPTPQHSASGKSLAIVSTPGMGFTPVNGNEPTDDVVTLQHKDDIFILENPYIRVAIGNDGGITSLLHKGLNREAVAVGQVANRFVLFDDDPVNFEAWDVDIFHLEKRYPVGGAHSVKVLEKGPLCCALEFTYSIGHASLLTQVVSLTAISPRLDFATQVDWHESQRFLKVEFPWEIRSEYATYEIQFGHLQRPTHFNTTWDLARFEVCGHKWADLSEPGFGVALLNDSKYGYSTQRNVMRLSLLRSPKSPDPVADMGNHSFRYGILPHAGDFREAGVIEEGYRFNIPLILHPGKLDKPMGPFFAVDAKHVVIDTVKKAEDGDAIIVRLYEAHGARGQVHFTSVLPIQQASLCNLLEEDEVPLSWNHGVELSVRPFEIITLKLRSKE
jgi:alpha-mannosidase